MEKCKILIFRASLRISHSNSLLLDLCLFLHEEEAKTHMLSDLLDNSSHQLQVLAHGLKEKEDVHHFSRRCIDKLICVDENGGQVDDRFSEDPVKLGTSCAAQIKNGSYPSQMEPTKDDKVSWVGCKQLAVTRCEQHDEKLGVRHQTAQCVLLILGHQETSNNVFTVVVNACNKGKEDDCIADSCFILYARHRIFSGKELV